MWPFKKVKPKKKETKWITETKSFNVQKADLVLTSTTGVTEINPIYGYVDQYSDISDLIIHEPYIVSVISVATKLINRLDKKITFQVDDRTFIYGQVLHKAEILNVEDHFLDVEVIVGYEIVETE
jgi:hypothetical protein